MNPPDSYGLALSGGAIIGVAAIVLMVTTGRIAGVSGMAARAFGVSASGMWGESACFVAGLFAAPAVFAFGSGTTLSPPVTAGLPVMLVAGLLVGAGATLGNGCTSGHGVCGLARLSPRSIVAVLVFLSAALLIGALRHVLGDLR